MNTFSFWSPLRWVKRLSKREVGLLRRSRQSFRAESLHRLETRQLLTGSVLKSETFSAAVPLQTTDFTAPIPLPKFDSTLGTLTEVDLSFNVAGVFNGTVTNNGPDPQTLSIAEEIDLPLSANVNDVSTTLLDPQLNASQTFTNLAGGGGVGIFGPFSPTQSASTTITTGPTFDLFQQGTGDVGLSLSTNTTQSSTGGGGNISSALGTSAGAIATVTYQYSVATVSLSGNVYDDLKGTGSLAQGDPPIPGTLLSLLNANGTVVATTTTGLDGTYSFSTDSTGNLLLAGTYSVVETQPAGYLQGTNTVGTVDGVTDGTLTGVDVIGSIVLGMGQDSVNNNFGEVLPVGLAGTVYEDVNGSGRLEAGDKPIPGTVITLFSATGVKEATTVTDAFGNYSFTTDSSGNPLAPGTYTIDEDQPEGYLQGTNTVGTVDGVTDGFLGGLDIISSIGLNSGQASLQNNFGEVLPVGLAGTVYDDVLHTGMLQAGDTPIGGVTVSLFNSSGLVATTTTDVSGNYSFTTMNLGVPLDPGTYTLVETQPAGYLQGTNTVGTVNGITVGNLPATDVIGSIVLTSGQASLHNNFGEILPTPPLPPTPVSPNVINVQRFGVHLQPTLVVLTFDIPLNPATASDPANYQVYGPTDSKHPALVPIQSAIYNPATNMVTLHFGERLDVHHPYRLTINGLQSTSGGLLIGSNGVAGSSFVTTLNRSNLSGFTDIYGNFIPINHGKLYPAAIASGYQLKRFNPPANLGSFAQANKAVFLAATVGMPETPPINYRSGKKVPKISKS